jgi:hypothetical protein
LYGAETLELRTVDQRHLESFKVVLEKDGEDQLDRTCEKLRSVKTCRGKENVLHKVNRGKGNWIGHILQNNCLLNHVNEGKTGEGYSDRKVRRKT